jgi:hypothetical protein
MSKQISKYKAPERLVKGPAKGRVELSEAELQKVAGGQKGQAASSKTAKRETSDYLVVTLTDAS